QSSRLHPDYITRDLGNFRAKAGPSVGGAHAEEQAEAGKNRDRPCLVTVLRASAKGLPDAREESRKHGSPRDPASKQRQKPASLHAQDAAKKQEDEFQIVERLDPKIRRTIDFGRESIVDEKNAQGGERSNLGNQEAPFAIF